MKNKILFLFALLSIYIGQAQQKDVKIATVKTDSDIAFNAINHSDVDQEVTLTLKVLNLRGYTRPVTKTVPANDTLEMVKVLIVKNKKYSYTSNYTYKPVSVDDSKPNGIVITDMNMLKRLMIEKTTRDVGDYNEGLVVFIKDGCPRSQLTAKHLIENGVDFRIVNISRDAKHDQLLWEILRKDTPMLQSFAFPVVINNGEVAYNMQDLQGYLDELTK
ncbi:hypothetical protein M0G43_07950 [Subsaxibacter sp. CAU 1640]|uniref:glutaredoxin domain-containing protein n=1 Tax=Subsaxibacter sp. CAU 1640 TaxID=2933271 RepID=UPI002005ABF9|nr:glutaredoxin domain-containing protein [Subsaxibacter sp. CAU 1640]MCK7590500.1 hypothetical protein [Subsaxibacter sp. CAU 1640]